MTCPLVTYCHTLLLDNVWYDSNTKCQIPSSFLEKICEINNYFEDFLWGFKLDFLRGFKLENFLRLWIWIKALALIVRISVSNCRHTIVMYSGTRIYRIRLYRIIGWSSVLILQKSNFLVSDKFHSPQRSDISEFYCSPRFYLVTWFVSSAFTRSCKYSRFLTIIFFWFYSCLVPTVRYLSWWISCHFFLLSQHDVYCVSPWSGKIILFWLYQYIVNSA